MAKVDKTFWRPKYFDELLKRLENSDIDPETFDIDKKRFYEMKNGSKDHCRSFYF